MRNGYDFGKDAVEPDRMIKLKSAVLILLLIMSSASDSAAQSEFNKSESFGILAFITWNHDWNNYLYADKDDIDRAILLIKELGVSIVRLDFLWSDIEPVKGVYNFEKHDYLVDELNKHGIEILGMLQYNAAWSDVWNTPPDTADFKKYSVKTVLHFKGRVKYWEVWNEPNYDDYWTPQDELKAYTELLKEVYPAIKQSSDDVKVLIGGLTGDFADDLEKVYQMGGGDSFDIVNIHAFQNPLDENAIDSIKKMIDQTMDVMQEYGDTHKRIWLTETGCPGLEDSSASRGWIGNPYVSRENQAQWLSRLYTEIPGYRHVDKVFWAFFRDTYHFGNDIDAFGLVAYDFTKKPAFHTFKELSEASQKQNI